MNLRENKREDVGKVGGKKGRNCVIIFQLQKVKEETKEENS